jgi:hypothetical protein
MIPVLDELDEKSVKRLACSILLSICIVGGGMGWTYQVGLKANKVDHELSHVRENIEALSQSIAANTPSGKG